MQTNRIPFKIGGIYAGWAKIEGLLIINREHLCFEYRVSDSWIGAFSSGIIKKTVEYADLEGAEFRFVFFRPRLIFTAKSLTTFESVPRSDPSTLEIGVPWKHRKALPSLVSEINLYILCSETDQYRRQLDNP